MELTKTQEENINKLIQEGIIPDKEQFIREAISKQLNKPGLKNQLKKLNKDISSKSEKDIVRRMGIKFHDKLEDIKKKRIKLKIDKKKISNGMLTDMILKHNDWKNIEEDLIHHEFAKK